MLLPVPTEILLAIFILAIIVLVALLILFGIYRVKQETEVRNEPEDIKRKADAPELPSEGQEDKPIDQIHIS